METVSAKFHTLILTSEGDKIIILFPSFIWYVH